MAVPPAAYVFAEADYMYGVGPLTLRIEVVDHARPVSYDRDIWLQVDGVQLDYRGADIGHRSALIRRRCLPTGVLPDWPARTAAPPADSR
jgi:hypothetical protein